MMNSVCVCWIVYFVVCGGCAVPVWRAMAMSVWVWYEDGATTTQGQHFRSGSTYRR